MATKRNDPNYAQITGHIPKEMSLRFRFACTAKGLDLSEGIESAIGNWLENTEQPEIQPPQPVEEETKAEEENLNSLKSLLEKLAEGVPVTTKELIIAAHDADIDEEILVKLKKKLLGNGNSKPVK